MMARDLPLHLAMDIEQAVDEHPDLWPFCWLQTDIGNEGVWIKAGDIVARFAAGSGGDSGADFAVDLFVRLSSLERDVSSRARASVLEIQRSGNYATIPLDEDHPAWDCLAHELARIHGTIESAREKVRERVEQARTVANIWLRRRGHEAWPVNEVGRDGEAG